MDLTKLLVVLGVGFLGGFIQAVYISKGELVLPTISKEKVILGFFEQCLIGAAAGFSFWSSYNLLRKVPSFENETLYGVIFVCGFVGVPALKRVYKVIFKEPYPEQEQAQQNQAKLAQELAFWMNFAQEQIEIIKQLSPHVSDVSDIRDEAKERRRK